MTGFRTRVRGRLRAVVILALAFALVQTVAAAQSPDEPKIDILQVGGALDGTIARYLDGALRTAADEGVEVVVLQLSTPGALDVEPRRFVELVADSPVPVAVWVGPPGARVTGAGVQVALAADVLTMAPGTVLGGAVPADLGDTADSAARGDVAARLTELARQRERSPELAAALATDGAAIVATLDDAPLAPDAALPPSVDRDAVRVIDEDSVDELGFVDLVADDLPDVLRSLNGLEVRRSDGTATTLGVDPATATIRFNNQGLLGRILHTVSTPTLAYLLLVGGIVALLFEWFQPGFGVAGISGVVVAALGVFGLTVLPTAWWAFALVVLGLLLMALDLAAARLGAMTASGAVALAAGSWWLYRGPDVLRLEWWLIALVVVSALVFFVFVMTTVLRAQGVQSRASISAVQGEVGVVRSVLNPQGHVFVAGALWRAQAPDDVGQIKTGARVRVTGSADEATLLVEPVDPTSPSPQQPARHA